MQLGGNNTASMSILSQVSTKQRDMQTNSSLDYKEPVILEQHADPNYCYNAFFPTLYPRFSYLMRYWPTYQAQGSVLQSSHEISKPVAVRLKSPINMEKFDDLRLSL